MSTRTTAPDRRLSADASLGGLHTAQAAVDIRNLIVLLVGFVLVMVAVPPARSFGLDDDWAYAQSVERMLHGVYRPHEWAQPTSLSHIAIGWFSSTIFGYSFTVLTVTNLAISLVCLVLLYGLLRQLGVTASYSLLGTAVLGLNPLYVYLSYSYMTDVTFLTYMLAALICYIRWFEGRGGEAWLWLGGLAGGLAFLTRQLGLLVPVVALVYLWWSGRWTWRRVLAVLAIPLIFAMGYTLWASMQPSQLVSLSLASMKNYILSHPWDYAVGHAQALAWALPLPGLFLLPVMRMPRRPVLAVTVFVFLAFFQVKSTKDIGTVFPDNGNLLSYKGFLAYGYQMNSLWPQPVWALLGIAGALALSLSVAVWAESLWSWLSGHPWQERKARPEYMVYLLAAALGAITLAVSPFVFDRYLLPLLPLVSLGTLLRRSTLPPQVQLHGPTRGSGSTWRYWALLAPVALFSVLGMRDFMNHSALRWQAASALVSHGVDPARIDNGYEWSGMNLYAQYDQYIRATGDRKSVPTPPEGPKNPDYVISDLPLEGYKEISRIPYRTWLAGGATRYVLTLKRD